MDQYEYLGLSKIVIFVSAIVLVTVSYHIAVIPKENVKFTVIWGFWLGVTVFFFENFFICHSLISIINGIREICTKSIVI